MANDELFDSIAILVARHSPSGAEHEIDAYLLAEIGRYDSIKPRFCYRKMAMVYMTMG